MPLLPGALKVEIAALVRARISALNGVALEQIGVLSVEQQRDSSQSRYKLSYSVNNIDKVTLVEGAWRELPGAGARCRLSAASAAIAPCYSVARSGLVWTA